LLRVIRAAHAPGKTIVQTRSQPIQAFGHVAIRSVVRRKEIAVWRERQIESIAVAFGENVTGLL